MHRGQPAAVHPTSGGMTRGVSWEASELNPDGMVGCTGTRSSRKVGHKLRAMTDIMVTWSLGWHRINVPYRTRTKTPAVSSNPVAATVALFVLRRCITGVVEPTTLSIDIGTPFSFPVGALITAITLRPDNASIGTGQPEPRALGTRRTIITTAAATWGPGPIATLVGTNRITVTRTTIS